MTVTAIALDDFLVAQFTEKMGRGSPYAKLKLITVVPVLLRDRKQWEALATECDIPAMMIEGNRVGYSPGPFGSGQVAVAQEFAYTAVAVLRAATDVLASRQIKEVADRTVQALTQMRVGINLDGQHPLSAIPAVGDVYFTIYRAQGAEAQWFGLGLVDFTVGKRRS